MEYGIFIVLLILSFALAVLNLILRGNIGVKLFLTLIIGFISVTFFFDNSIVMYSYNASTNTWVTNTITQPLFPYLPMLLIIIAIIGLIRNWL